MIIMIPMPLCKPAKQKTFVCRHGVIKNQCKICRNEQIIINEKINEKVKLEFANFFYKKESIWSKFLKRFNFLKRCREIGVLTGSYPVLCWFESNHRKF